MATRTRTTAERERTRRAAIDASRAERLRERRERQLQARRLVEVQDVVTIDARGRLVPDLPGPSIFD